MIALAWPVAVSPIHSSMPLSRMLREGEALAVGEKPIHAITGDGGSVTFRSLPSAITFSVRLRYALRRDAAPLVRGLMRTPASR